MSETANYRLYVEDDDAARFLDWRKRMNGSGDSNMTKIDAILREKADASRPVTTTLYADKWIKSDGVYTQDIIIAGLTPEQNGVIDVDTEADDNVKDTVCLAGLYIKEQDNDTLTIAVNSNVPTCDIPVLVILIN